MRSDFQLDTSVLRKPLFSDVELGHDLDPRDDGGLEFLWNRFDIMKDTVNPVPDL